MRGGMEPAGRARRRGTRGQSTVEYALVLLAFIWVAIGCAALWRGARDGRLLSRAIDAASHTFGDAGPLVSLRDISLF